MDTKWDNVKNAIFTGNIAGIPILVKRAISDGVPVKDILNKGLIAGMSIVGEKFKSNEIFVPEVLISAKTMQAGLDILEPLLVKAGVNPAGKIVIGTARGDLHDIGKNLVSMMLKGGGFSVIDLGIDVAPRRFIDEAIKSDALITTSMPSMKATIDLLKSENLNAKIKAIIGGAPVTQEYADEIGADGYADNASSAVDKVKELLGL